MKKILTVAAVSLLAVSCSSHADSQNHMAQKDQKAMTAPHAQTTVHAAATTSTALTTDMEKVSYSIGYDLGKSFKQQSVDVNSAQLSQGLQAALTGAKPAMTEKEMKQTMQDFQKQMIEKMVKKQKEEAKSNMAASEAYLAKVAKEPGVKMLEKGLYYKVIKAGHGPMPTAKDTVVVNYKGMLSNGKVFDSSYKRGEPATFQVNQVIPGWTKALEHMPVGSTWKVYIAPKLAYGKYAPPTIGPNQALTFKIELKSIKKAADHKDMKAHTEKAKHASSAK